MADADPMDNWLRGLRDFPRMLDENRRAAETRLSDLKVEGSALDGGVVVKLTGDLNVEAVIIDPDYYKDLEPDELGEAVRHAYAEAQKEVAEQRSRIKLGVIGL